MKKYLFIALALLGMASCAKDDLGNGNKPNHNGEVEESYIAINLMAADVDSRAEGSPSEDFGLEYGRDAERAIKSAHFFFYKDGEPFTVNATNDAATAPGGTQNHLKLTISKTGSTADPAVNVSDISEAVLVLKTYKGEYPNQIVAVLNWTPVDNKSYTLSDLRDIVEANSLGNDDQGYVMSNSVYMNNADEPVYVTPITADNIKTDPKEATDAPVEIYVERTAAKVIVTNTKATENSNRYQVTEENGFKPVGEAARNVYVELLGWELYNEFENTNLLKKIENWDPATLGLTWNDIPFFRSYWAKTINTRTENDKFRWNYTLDTGASTFNGLPTQYGYKVASDASYAADTYAYCGENTLDWATNDVRTKVILKGRLVEKVGENYQTLELARWYGNEYAGEIDLKTAVANSLAYSVFYYDTTNSKYVSIDPSHIEIVHGDVVGAEAFQVGFQLTADCSKYQWYKYSSATGYVAFSETGLTNIEAANKYLKGIQPAVLYKGGDTYYIVDIKHLGKSSTAPAYYGVVRNHVYQLDIQSISGYGSPGYSGFEHEVENPEYPDDEDESSYVAAKINVLSWKVVKQTVDIVQ